MAPIKIAVEGKSGPPQRVDTGTYDTFTIGAKPGGGFGIANTYDLIRWRVAFANAERMRLRPSDAEWTNRLNRVIIHFGLTVIFAFAALIGGVFFSNPDANVPMIVLLFASFGLVPMLYRSTFLFSWYWSEFWLWIDHHGALSVRRRGWRMRSEDYPIEKLRRITYGCQPRGIYSGGTRVRKLDEEWIWDITLEFSDTPDYAVGWPVRFMLGSVPDRPSGFGEAPEVLIQLGRWLQGATGVVVEEGRIDRGGSR